MRRRKAMLTVALSLTLAFAQAASVGAVTLDEVKQQKSDLQQQQAATSQKLQDLQGSIGTLEEQKKEILGEIDSLDADLVTTIAAINTLDGQIEDKEAEIVQTTVDLGKAQTRENESYEAMKKRIQYIYENGGDIGWGMMLLSEDSLSQVLNQAEFAQNMYKYDRECLEEYAGIVEEVKELKTDEENQKAEYEEMKSEQEGEKKNLEGLLDEAKKTSKDYDRQLETANEKAGEYQQLLTAQNEKIQELAKEQQRLEEEARKKAEEEARKAAEAEAARKAAEEEEAARAAAAEEEARRQAEEEKSYDDTEEQDASEEESYDDYDGGSYDEDSDSDADDVSYDDSDDYDASSSYDEDDGSSYDEDSDYEEEEEEEEAPASSGGSAAGQAIVDYAMQFVGNPYVWGGNSLTNGTDCSGFVNLVYSHFGYSVPRQSAAFRSAGRGVSYAEAQPGDIICYSGHVAIYMGGGQIVHASDPTRGIICGTNAAYHTILAVRRVV